MVGLHLHHVAMMVISCMRYKLAILRAYFYRWRAAQRLGLYGAANADGTPNAISRSAVCAGG